MPNDFSLSKSTTSIGDANNQNSKWIEWEVLAIGARLKVLGLPAACAGGLLNKLFTGLAFNDTVESPDVRPRSHVDRTFHGFHFFPTF